MGWLWGLFVPIVANVDRGSVQTFSSLCLLGWWITVTVIDKLLWHLRFSCRRNVHPANFPTDLIIWNYNLGSKGHTYDGSFLWHYLYLSPASFCDYWCLTSVACRYLLSVFKFIFWHLQKVYFSACHYSGKEVLLKHFERCYYNKEPFISLSVLPIT